MAEGEREALTQAGEAHTEEKEAAARLERERERFSHRLEKLTPKKQNECC